VSLSQGFLLLLLCELHLLQQSITLCCKLTCQLLPCLLQRPVAPQTLLLLTCPPVAVVVEHMARVYVRQWYAERCITSHVTVV